MAVYLGELAERSDGDIELPLVTVAKAHDRVLDAKARLFRRSGKCLPILAAGMSTSKYTTHIAAIQWKSEFTGVIHDMHLVDSRLTHLSTYAQVPRWDHFAVWFLQPWGAMI